MRSRTEKIIEWVAVVIAAVILLAVVSCNAIMESKQSVQCTRKERV